MAEAAVKFLLENVKNVVKDQVDLISGAEEDLQKLQTMLEKMEAALKDLTMKQAKGNMIIQLEKHIREAVYNAEDAIDASLTFKSREQTNQWLPRTRNLSLAKKVKEMTENVLKPLYVEAKEACNSQQGPDVSAATRTGRSDDNILQKFLSEGKVVGFADEEATLIGYLEEETEELDVISIVGMPGLGKTTLAWKIYRGEKAMNEFPMLIWVYLSQVFNAKDVFLTILKKFTNHDMSSKNVDALAREVRSHLKKGRFLLFIDDVWNLEDWEQIKAALPKKNKMRSKVLITSRNASVAGQANRNRAPHQLRFLNFKESRELLHIEVFGRSNGCPWDLTGLGELIAEQCGGVPLAVVVIGGILVEQCGHRRDLWKKVSESVTEYLYNKDEQKRTENIILLSYNQLPHDLRDCFLYLGMFPKDTEIPAWKLIRLWIAEGFIRHNQYNSRSLEEVAEDNLNDLVARNLVMVEKFKANGDVKTCRVHDMIREFCKNEAALEKLNLFQEVKKTREGVFAPTMSEIEKCRRLCIHSNVMEFLQQKPINGPKVRSFLCFSKETVNLPKVYSSLIPEAFELLRVIDASPIKFTIFPQKLTKLIHLRYITLSGSEFKALPKGASKLWNLQTVKIDTTAREFEIKADIGKMKQLRHLKTKAAIVLNEVQGDEGGENLQTLSRLSTKSCTEKVFRKAKNVKNLGIRGPLQSLLNANNLEKLERLEKLKLVHDTFQTAENNELSRLPQPHNFPPKLRILTLSSTFLDWTEMATLGSLRKLEVLKLKEMAFMGSLWEANGTNGGFPCLQSLHISRTNLEIWTAFDNPFPKLKNLILKNCEKLQEIPSLLEKTLQLVEIERVSPALVLSAKRIKKGKQQIQGEGGAKKGVFKLIISPGDA